MIRTLAATAALSLFALGPLPASAAHVTITGDFQADGAACLADGTVFDCVATSIAPGDIFETEIFLNNTDDGSMYIFEFIADGGIAVLESNSVNFFQEFEGAFASLLDSAMTVLATIQQGDFGDGITSSFAAGETFFVKVGWDAFTGPKGNFDVLVRASAAEVPIPASILLLGSAMAGLGFLGRRRKDLA